MKEDLEGEPNEPYETPELFIYGNVDELTRTIGGGTGGVGGPGSGQPGL